jgi:hypothetical protein
LVCDDLSKSGLAASQNSTALHRMNLAHLPKINAPTGTVEEGEDDLSDIEDLQEDLGGLQSLATL